MRQALKETIHLVLAEVLGKFDFQVFKNIAAKNVRPKTKEEEEDFAWNKRSHPEIDYARRFLPELGQGSSRITFALSGGKVLKISMNQKGNAQNQEEVSISTHNKDNHLVCKVFDFDPNYIWIVSEIVKPFETISEFMSYTGTNYEVMRRFLNFKDLKSFKDEIQYRINHNYQTATDPHSSERTKIDAKDNLRIWQQIRRNLITTEATPKALQFLLDVHKMVMSHDLASGDIVPSHFGRTVDGQVRLYDYGASKEIMRTHYGVGT